MTVSKNNVLLLKAPKSNDSEDKYENILLESGYTVDELKTINFNFINLDVLRDKLFQPNSYFGIILSSPRCVEAVQKALQGDKLSPEWKTKLNNVVGESTYNNALKILELDCKGKDSGNGENLSKIIVEDCRNEKNKSFLMPCGNLRTDTIENQLNAYNIKTEAVVVYETTTNSLLKQEFATLTNNFQNIPEFVVFFSPSGVKAFSECLDNIKNYLTDIKFVSIGPTTKKAIEALNLKVFSTAQKPTPKDLLIAIQCDNI